MPKSRSAHVSKSDDAGEDLRNALGRLRRGQPLHPDLVKAKREGRLRISILAVAKEANRSRTLIGTDACPYPDIRREVLALAETEAKAPKVETKELTAQEIITSLREEIRLLRQEKAILATRVQDAVNVARTLEKELKGAKRKASRRIGRLSHPDQVVGRERTGSNVVTFPETGDN